MNVAVLGASNKPERYSYKALVELKNNGHIPYPINPALKIIEGIPVCASLADLPLRPDIVTVYLAPARQNGIADDLAACGAKLVIFNPGTENPELANRLRSAGQRTLNACTLVLLSTAQLPIP